jgi:hypothetical protein
MDDEVEYVEIPGLGRMVPRKAPTVAAPKPLPRSRYRLDVDGDTVDFRLRKRDGYLEAVGIDGQPIAGGHDLIDRLRCLGSQGARDAAAAYGLEFNVCGKCGKELTDPESIARGMGLSCWRSRAWESFGD